MGKSGKLTKFRVLAALLLIAVVIAAWAEIVPRSVLVSVLLIIITLILMRVTVRLIMQRGRRIHNGEQSEGGSNRNQ